MHEVGVSDAVDEDKCAICARVPPRERDALRASLDKLPLDEPVCDACQMAFWRNLGLPVSDTDEPAPDEPTAH
jgi:hypothetical protein